ncbi:hypothetical protein HK17_14365 [Acetobacter indonesiensis]|uniref:Uncharacterized protein n=1 Tax=Acetobacter indonesiensis TaxID=104101 RepID=A0A252AX52_9PROT|nr:hypothetical protein HK17_14365 [Acetobacter indonesiensis]
MIRQNKDVSDHTKYRQKKPINATTIINFMDCNKWWKGLDFPEITKKRQKTKGKQLPTLIYRIGSASRQSEAVKITWKPLCHNNLSSLFIDQRPQTNRESVIYQLLMR